MTHGSAWSRAAYGRSVRAVRQSGPSERSLVRLNRTKLGSRWLVVQRGPATFKRIKNTSTGDDAHHGRIGPLPVHQRSYLGIKVVADLLVGRRLHRPPYTHRADGRPREPWAVVDEVGAVKGLTSLRVVDASIIPEVPSATTNFTTIMVAELIYEGVYAR